MHVTWLWPVQLKHSQCTLVCNKTNNVNQLFYYCNIFYWQCWQILILSREEQMLLLHLVDHVGRYFVASWIRWSSWLMHFFNLPFLSFLPLLILSVNSDKCCNTNGCVQIVSGAVLMCSCAGMAIMLWFSGVLQDHLNSPVVMLFNCSLTLWRPVVPHGYSYKASCARPV